MVSPRRFSFSMRLVPPDFTNRAGEPSLKPPTELETPSVLSVSVTPEFLQLRLDEVRLSHEYEQKRYQEREEQRRIREQIRDEEKAKQEIESAREEAELEEARFQKALERAREEAAKATGAQLRKLTEQVSSFESKLDEARKKKERAISRAQLTKSGF